MGSQVFGLSMATFLTVFGVPVLIAVLLMVWALMFDSRIDVHDGVSGDDAPERGRG